MMIRRFNYTKREKISRKDIKITLQIDGEKIWFEADLSELKSYDLPPDSPIFVEAYRQTNWVRFDFGKINSITPPNVCDISSFGTYEGILFRVKVTDSEKGKLLAEADQIPCVLPEEKDSPLEPLLKIRPQNLGAEIYRIDYSDERNGPILLINSYAGNYERIGRNPAFDSLVYPAVLREVLRMILYVEDQFEITDRSDWRSRWLIFAKSFPGSGKMPENKDDKDECNEWIDKVVSAFCKKVKTFEKFSEFWSHEA